MPTLQNLLVELLDEANFGLLLMFKEASGLRDLGWDFDALALDTAEDVADLVA